jgi:hypothetical protein
MGVPRTAGEEVLAVGVLWIRSCRGNKERSDGHTDSTTRALFIPQTTNRGLEAAVKERTERVGRGRQASLDLGGLDTYERAKDCQWPVLVQHINEAGGHDTTRIMWSSSTPTQSVQTPARPQVCNKTTEARSEAAWCWLHDSLPGPAGEAKHDITHEQGIGPQASLISLWPHLWLGHERTPMHGSWPVWDSGDCRMGAGSPEMVSDQEPSPSSMAQI